MFGCVENSDSNEDGNKDPIHQPGSDVDLERNNDSGSQFELDEIVQTVCYTYTLSLCLLSYRSSSIITSCRAFARLKRCVQNFKVCFYFSVLNMF